MKMVFFFYFQDEEGEEGEEEEEWRYWEWRFNLWGPYPSVVSTWRALEHEYIHVCLYVFYVSCWFRSFCLDWLYIRDKWMCLSAGDQNNYANRNSHTPLLFKIASRYYYLNLSLPYFTIIILVVHVLLPHFVLQQHLYCYYYLDFDFSTFNVFPLLARDN